MDGTPFAIPALVGAALQEVVHWYDLRKHLDREKDREPLTSMWYWIWTIVMIALTPVAVHYWYEGDGSVRSRTLLLTGAAMPLLLKKVVRSFLAPENQLGAKTNNGKRNFRASDYFSR